MQYTVVWKEYVTGIVEVQAASEEEARTQFYAQYVDDKPAACGKGIGLEPDSDFLGIEIDDVQCEEESEYVNDLYGKRDFDRLLREGFIDSDDYETLRRVWGTVEDEADWQAEGF